MILGVFTGEVVNGDLTLKKCVSKFPIFCAIAVVNLTGVQWKDLDFGEYSVNFNKY